MAKGKPPTKQITFTEDDVSQMRLFGQFLQSFAKFNVSIPEAIQLHKFLVFYNSITSKIENHIMEVKSITKLDEVPDAGNSDK